MNESPLEMRLTEWLHRAPPKGPESVLAATLARTRAVGQRSQWRVLVAEWTTDREPAGRRLRTAAALVLTVVGLAIAVAAGSLLGSHLPAVVSPSATVGPTIGPTATPIPTESGSPGETPSPPAIALPAPPPGNAWASIHWSMPDPAAFAGPRTFLANVVPFGTGFVGVGKDDQGGTLTAVVWFSQDGRHWERHEGGAAFAGFLMTGVSAGPDGLVATGGSSTAGAAAWRSTDGRRWVREATSTGAFRGPTAVGPSGVIGTVGFGKDFAVSAAPGKWEELSGATVLKADGLDLADAWGDQSVFALVGSAKGADQLCHAAAWWSVDGRTWAPASITDPGAGFAYATSALGRLLVQGVTGSCAAGPNATGFWLSPDGRDYRSVSVPLPADWCAGAYSTRCLAGDGNRIVLVGPNGEVAFSEDGATWWRSASTIEGSETFDPQAQGYVALAVGKPGIVVVVTNGINVQQLWLGEPAVP